MVFVTALIKRGVLYYVIIKGDFTDKKMNILNKA